MESSNTPTNLPDKTSLIEAEIFLENESLDNHEKTVIDDWKHDKWILMLVFVLILIAGYLVFPTSTQPAVGTYCTVQFRLDLLGATITATGPVLPFSDMHSGDFFSVYGKLTSIDNQGIMLQVEQGDEGKKNVRSFWIPRSSILLIEQHKKKKAPE